MQETEEAALGILREEYPSLSLTGDTDIERYFELRKMGRQADALAVYDGKLRKKYPDDGRRAELLRSWRSRDPRFSSLLEANVRELAARSVRRTVLTIDFLTRDIDSVNMGDAYAVIKLAEGLLSAIPGDRYAAISFTERYARLARTLSHKEEAMERAAELIRLYVTDTIESVLEFRKLAEERRAVNERERHRRQRRVGLDLSRITFSPEDLRRILIPEGITGTEDTVIAYCMKYWNLTGDPAFEKTVLLYSRKYKTRHFEIFSAIKNGREHGWKDEEILNAVLANVVTGYYYSISGDLYLQRTWARYKPSAGTTAPALPAAAPLSVPGRQAAGTSGVEGKAGKAPSRGRPKKTGKPARSRAREKARERKILKNTASAAARRTASSASRASVPAARYASSSSRLASTLKAKPFAPNSVADMIRKETGKTYTVYKDLFFRDIRPSIRDALGASANHRSNPFSSRQNEAEEIVFGFLSEHFNNPYLNWEESEERRRLENLGYSLPRLEPIIAAWVKTNR